MVRGAATPQQGRLRSPTFAVCASGAGYFAHLSEHKNNGLPKQPIAMFAQRANEVSTCGAGGVGL